MSTVKKGDYVQVHYNGTLENGDVFDTSRGGQPLEIKVGEGHLIKGFENALMGMAKDEKKSFTLGPEEAYGQRDASLERAFDRSQIPYEMDPKVGDTVALQTAAGQQIPVRIKDVSEERIVVDLNHPLAGESLNFDIEVVGITDNPTQAGGCCGHGAGHDDACCGHGAGHDDACGGCGSHGSCCE